MCLCISNLLSRCTVTANGYDNMKIGAKITCEICGKEFIKKTSSQQYCSAKCCKKAQAEKRKEINRWENTRYAEIGTTVVCQNPSCKNTFVKKTGMHRFCCVRCREDTRGIPKSPKECRNKTINEVLEIMRNMRDEKSYGRFCAEHPELLK